MALQTRTGHFSKLVAGLIHTNIIQSFRLGKTGEQYLMTMEYIHGVNLAQFLDRHVELSRFL